MDGMPLLRHPRFGQQRHRFWWERERAQLFAHPFVLFSLSHGSLFGPRWRAGALDAQLGFSDRPSLARPLLNFIGS